MWIVTGSKEAKEGMITLVSSKQINKRLPVGSYLTIIDNDQIKHILLVRESYQKSLFEPSYLIVDAGLPKLSQDQECKNIIYAEEIRQFPLSQDGLFNFIRPNDLARRTTQNEINEIFNSKEGYPVFLATNYLRQNAILREDQGKPIFVKIPFYSFYLQTMICGQTGSGKTVAMKYMIDQFRAHEKGAVLAINVKSNDLLTMDQPTTFENSDLEKIAKEEWKTLNLNADEKGEYSIYSPYSGKTRIKEGVTRSLLRNITLRTKDLEPDSLLGVLQNYTERSAEALPNIFRYWKERAPKENVTFRTFINWLRDIKEQNIEYPTLSQIGEMSKTKLHPGTFDSIIRSLEAASVFFDNPGDCLPIDENSILTPGKLSVIDLSAKDTLVFGAVLLYHLIQKIYEAKAIKRSSDVPVLIVIDEVHYFYGTSASQRALEGLNAIARMGRSEKIGVIFASQNPEDLPPGLTTIVNTRIFFRSLETIGKKFDVKGVELELSSLESGYALMTNVAMPEVRFIKFPLSLMGVKS